MVRLKTCLCPWSVALLNPVDYGVSAVPVDVVSDRVQDFDACLPAKGFVRY